MARVKKGKDPLPGWGVLQHGEGAFSIYLYQDHNIQTKQLRMIYSQIASVIN